ncbi:hypothetical protein, partial [Citrobacter freundii]|uniref:hypothetical protein n=2 Tax=Citrobacter freundii TaxID=546 RepID=UPI000A9D93AC
LRYKSCSEMEGQDQLLATPIDFASGKKYTVLEAVVKPETKTTPDAMIFNVLIRIVILDTFFLSHSIVDRVFIP